MAYNFSAVQRLSDGKYQCVCGDWRTLDFTSNYSAVRFYYSDADDVANYITGYPVDDYRVVEYWMPGKTSTNPPKSNNTLLGNFAGSLYAANAVTIDTQSRDIFTSSTQAFINAMNDAIINRQAMWLVLSEAEINTYGFRNFVPGAEVRGALQPDAFYVQVIDYDGRNFILGDSPSGMGGQSFQYEVTA